MRFLSYLNTAMLILGQFKGDQPFSLFARNFFAKNKKYGSTDRKHISKLCYAFFRLGKAYPEMKMEDRILAGLFLCSPSPNELLQNLRPEWNEQTNLPPEEKFAIIEGMPGGRNDALFQVFPWHGLMSDGIDYRQFLQSLFIQPDLFLRVRPGKVDLVLQKLADAGISYEILSGTCLALPNTSRADQAIDINRDAVIQDYSSQQVGSMLQLIAEDHQAGISVWDCCAGSGGKSILACDLFSNPVITVSDIRESILRNLKKRFEEAGIKEYTAFEADLGTTGNITDLSKEAVMALSRTYQLVIADVPCTGSGTWGRTPEQLYYFDASTVRDYSSRQRRIVSRAIQQVAPNGHFLYITCSVFREENEEVVEYIRANTGLRLLRMELFKGYNRKADTLFAALFAK